MAEPRTKYRILRELLSVSLVYLPACLIVVGLLVGNQLILWIGVGSFVAMIAAAILYALWLGFTIPMEILARWSTLTSAERRWLGTIGIVVAAGVFATCILAGMVVMQPA